MAAHPNGKRIASASAAAFLGRVRAAGQAVRAVLGVSDYERYRAHVCREHPHAEILSREEFAAQRLESRYNKPGSRCC